MVEVPAVDATYWPQMIQTRSNSCSEPMIDRNAQMRMVGPISGRTMWRWICQYEAPSMAAASLSSSGMPWSPARNRITAKPMYFHVMMISSVQMASAGSEIQSARRAPSPIFSRAPFSAPPDCSMRPQPRPTTTSEMT